MAGGGSNSSNMEGDSYSLMQSLQNSWTNTDASSIQNQQSYVAPGQESYLQGMYASAANAARGVPVLGVGGVTLENAARLAATDCAGFAAIGLFSDGPEEDVPATVTAALAAWDNSR